ncbi:ABC transporter substrate-binding protein [Nakamurella panacisegetis]|nr:ABC transporter substrate-binding protein [Nakamurella panacisegetis]
MRDRGRRARRRPRSLVVLALLALATTACTPPGLPAPIAPTAASAAGSAQPSEPAVTIGVDGTVEGFNPHTIADYSLVDSAVSQLVLPSVSTVASDGSVQLNSDVVSKAEVTSTDPFTVTYTVDRNAAWSDGTPITGEDFSYLRDQMLIQPGTVDPAGYRLISGIVSRDAGKTVQVTFTHSVSDWKTLFSPLLPSHILKDSPGGWTEGLATSLPVSGNRYKMQSYDTVTGEITLVRNDKYWGAAPKPGTVIIRIGTSSALIAALGRGDVQAVLLQPGEADQRTLLARVPATRRAVVPLPGTQQLVFNTVRGPAADPNVRRAVAATLDVAALRSVLDGGNSALGQSSSSLVSLGGSASTQAPDRSAALSYLAAAGYHRESVYMSKAGQILRLTLTYAANDARMAAAAALVQTQLAAIGIEVDLIRDDQRAMVNSRLALGTADLGLLMVPRGPSDGLAVGSAFGCPVGTGSSGGVAGRNPVPRAGNLSGLCTTGIQALLDQASAGTVPAGLQSALATALPVIQISRPSAIFATSSRYGLAAGKSGPGWAFSGPLSTLPTWPAS